MCRINRRAVAFARYKVWVLRRNWYIETKKHRGSVNLEKNSLEELCVADADAISHFDSVPSLLYLAYVQRGMEIEEGKEFVKDKLTRSFQKLSAESKKYYQNKFEKVMEVLN